MYLPEEEGFAPTFPTAGVTSVPPLLKGVYCARFIQSAYSKIFKFQEDELIQLLQDQ